MVPFQRYFESHRAAVWRFAVASVGHADADDLFQETWLAALRGYDRRTAADAGVAWVMTIAHRRAMDHHRAGARRPVPVDALPQTQVLDEPPAGDDAVWLHVRALPDKQRAAVVLRAVAGLSHTEVAGVMGCSPDAARRAAHEGFKRLRSEVVR